MAFKMLKFQHQ